jgi:putative peptidoglycan lipid II flippase
MTRVMFPYVLFIGLTALSMGILNACGRFAAPALAPVVLNLSIIGSVVFLSPQLETPVLGPAIGVAAGGVLQLALQWPWLRRCGLVLRPRGPLRHPGLSAAWRRLPPAVIGAAVLQINVWIDTILASLLGEGSISYLYYADRLVQFPLGIVAVAAATAALPSFSRQAASGDTEALGRSLQEGLRLVMFLMLPAMVGLVVLRRPIVAVLFGRGAFGPETVHLTASAVLYYGIGLWAFAGARMVVAAFFALKDTRIPFAAAIAAIGANVLLGLALMKPLGPDGLALSTTLAAAVHFVVLVLAAERRFGAAGWKEGLLAGLRVLVCAGIMGLTVHGAALYFASGGSGTSAGALAVCVMVGVAVFGALSLVWKLPELRMLAGGFRKTGKHP